jgi:hypothetical protein
MKPYFTLLEKNDAGLWTIEFGAYDKADCKSELEDRLDHDVRRKNLKIITTGPKQAEIDAAVAKLNQETGKTMASDMDARARKMVEAADEGDERAQATIVQVASLEPSNRTAFQQALVVASTKRFAAKETR